MLVVVVVVDRHPDVVQHARGPQQLALEGIPVVQARRRELVEEPEGERGDVVGVRPVDAVLAGEVQHGVAADVVEEVIGPRQQGLEEDALAQPCLRDLDALEAADLQDRLHDDCAGEDDVGAGGLDARRLAALGRGHRGQVVDQLAQRLARDQEALHPDVRLAGEVLRGGREVADRPAHAHEPVARPRQPGRRGELVGDVRAQRLELLAWDRRRRRAGSAPSCGPRRAATTRARSGGARARARAAGSRPRGRGPRRRTPSWSSRPRGGRTGPPARSRARGRAARSPPARARRTPCRCARRGSRSSPPAGRRRCRAPGRSGRRRRSCAARAPSARRRAPRSPRGPRRCARPRRSRPSASTSHRPP